MAATKILLAIPAIVLPIAALLSTNCGIVALPIEAPKVLATNAQTLKFDVSIVDQSGRALDGVTVDATRYAIRADPIFIELGDSKSDPPRLVDKTLTYDSFGKYAVVIRFSKPGYSGYTCAYANRSDVDIRPPGLIVPPIRYDALIDIQKHPHSVVVLHSESKSRPTDSQVIRP